MADILEEDLKTMSDPNYVDIDYTARKDVLLEFASIGHLLPDDETEEMRADSKAMGLLYHEIMMTQPENIDYQATLEKIKAIRYKYENPCIYEHWLWTLDKVKTRFSFNEVKTFIYEVI